MEAYLNSVIKRFQSYKALGEKTFSQLKDEDLLWQYNQQSNSIAIIVQHMAGNMLSRWTDFLNTDGEKEWRKRDAEFESVIITRQELLAQWNEGWDCLFNALNSITDADWEKTVYIRNEPHSVVDAINRQLTHYPYHVGQIVLIGKMLTADWKPLSIPPGKSDDFNAEKFNK
jgi:hypothetical protein